jgi:excisionase family DNA binding protein
MKKQTRDEKKQYISIPELAKMLDLSRVAVFKKVKSGQIKAIRIGRTYGIPRKYIDRILGNVLSEENKREIDKAVKKTVAEYGETLKLLGNE